ncbi:MAG: helix-turn-helix domain-containing protein [Pseudomonadota bacterium]
MSDVAPDAFVADCPTRGIVARLAEKWTMLTLAALMAGPMRFGALRRRIEGVSQKMLTKTLRNLEDDGLVLRQVFDERPLRVEYSLTPLGAGCAVLVNDIKRWAEHNMHAIQRHNRARDG